MQIAIIGYGVVGSGVADVIMDNYDDIKRRAGTGIDIRYILDLRDFPNSPFEDKFTKDFGVILNDPDVGAVVETMGGTEPAFTYTKQLLEAGKSVITSNKELVAEKGAQLLEIARDNNVNFLFEASVGGGVPIIRPINQCLAANKIRCIYGILNGTTNYILTKMVNEHTAFEEALRQAQEKGYAERNPDADILGKDTLRKICILTSLATGKHVYPSGITAEGIDKLTVDDVRLALKAGYTIKLLGLSKLHDDGSVYIITAPFLVPLQSPVSSVDDVFNAILVNCSYADDIMFFGRGAGKMPTASAVVADVIDAAKHTEARKWIHWDDSDNSFVSDIGEEAVCMMIRISAKDRDSMLKSANEAFGNCFFVEADTEGEYAVFTPCLKEKDIISHLNSIKGTVIKTIRVLSV